MAYDFLVKRSGQSDFIKARIATASKTFENPFSSALALRDF